MRQILSSLPLERITYILKGKPQIFENIWKPFINYVKDLDLTDDQMNDKRADNVVPKHAESLPFFLHFLYISSCIALTYLGEAFLFVCFTSLCRVNTAI